MAVALHPMLDFSKLKTPADDGGVLIAPSAPDLVAMARSNHRALAAADVGVLDSTLAECRRRAREGIVGSDDRLIIVTGHDPTFIHAGVWAKHVVAARLAEALDGQAVNLVVDSDAPKRMTLDVPSISHGVPVVTRVPGGKLAAGRAYEQIGRWSEREIATWEQNVRQAMGDRFGRSSMPTFCDALHGAGDAGDWVDQIVTARRAIESDYAVSIADRRISRVWASPLLLDMLLRAESFAASYNRALAEYRRRYRVRGAQRPIPDLHCADGSCEAAVWAYRADLPRQRLFVRRSGSIMRLYAQDHKIAEIPLGDVSRCDGVDALLAALGDWRLRPRALTLTLWARLFLADLFIHGIGGAKYDRITDAIMTDYYALAPPSMACVSATLHLDLPFDPIRPEAVRELRRSVRDFIYNPQRHLERAEDIAPLLDRRRVLVRNSNALRKDDAGNRAARREVFDALRKTNAELIKCRKEELAKRRSALEQGLEALQHSETAVSREYFFGLHGRTNIKRLLDTLPHRRDFGV